jgi:four helix bundle protein
MGDYRSLRVWREAHEVTLQVYDLTMRFPAAERYGLTSQMRRSAASVPSNLAEGCGRDSDAEIARFARVALGSASELEYQLLLAHDLNLLEPDLYRSVSRRVARIKHMLARLAARLSTDDR